MYTITSYLILLVGWASTPAQAGNGYAQPYDQSGYAAGQQDIGVKGRIINLISAVRTLMRSTCTLSLYFTLLLNCTLIVPLIAINLVIIVYEMIAG